MTAVEKLLYYLPNSINMEFKEQIEQVLEMEKKQREKDFVEGYKKRAELSNLIFDEASELCAKELFNETLKSK